MKKVAREDGKGERNIEHQGDADGRRPGRQSMVRTFRR